MSMKAVVFRGPFDVGIEQRPRSHLQDSTDAIVRVNIAGICGRFVFNGIFLFLSD